ncbi:MAG TPA: hypothetical protein VFQ85_19340 [Mycobacteriales bacterium]|jgi:hypothetical protein|nr:hypothetical protein [Mycobacteriales bacterium]
MLTARRAAAVAAALAAIGGCTATEAARPSPSPAPVQRRPRDPGPPFVMAVPVPPTPQPGPDVSVAAAGVTPHGWVPIGGTVRLTITLVNHSDRSVPLHPFTSYSKRMQLRTVAAPPGSTDAIWCHDDYVEPPPPEDIDPAPYCTPRSGQADITLRPRERRTVAWTVRVMDFQCPGAGDFQDELRISAGSYLDHRPDTFRLFVWFANDTDDYAAAKARYPYLHRTGAPACRSRG